MTQTLNTNALSLDKLKELGNRFSVLVVTNLDHYDFVLRQEKKLPYLYAKLNKILPLEEKDGVLWIATAAPFDLDIIEEIKSFFSIPVKEVFCPLDIIEHAIEKCYRKSEEEASGEIIGLNAQAIGDSAVQQEGYDLLESKSDAPVIRMLNIILVEAIQQGASDIHFDPSENSLEVRYRIDGVLQKRHSPPKELQNQLLTRIKVLAKLDIAEHRLPQDGRIKLFMSGRSIDFRISTVPVVYGERIVLRILDKGNVVLGLDELCMDTNMLKRFREHIKQNQGIVLVTGPTGSGKTTTLYSAVSEIHSSEINIMTIEDPVEYKFSGMAQIGVNPKIGLDFATGLRHILRQDPDVIMIGEIRDKETAEIAIQASLTGHLVLSTLHTNDAPSALTRLVDMGIESYLLSSSVIAVLAQRLVRLICPHCKESYHPSKEELSDLRIDDSLGTSFLFYRGKGCEKCFQSGYKGRHGIYELMNVNTKIKRQLLHSADSDQLQKVALEEGMKDLRSTGRDLVIKGLTTTSEVLRVTRQTHLEES